MIIQENTIIHGDSLTVLRQMEPESVDAIITDPPYGINYVSQTGASIKNDKSPFIWFLYDAFRVLKSGEAGRGGLICFTRWDVEQTFIDAMKIAGFNVKSEVIWDMLNAPEEKIRAMRGSVVSMIFQDPMSALNSVMTVGAQIMEVLKIHHPEQSTAQLEARVDEMMELVGIPAKRKVEYPHQFSGGMKQRIVIAIALACEPKLILADEPTTALDVTIQAQMLGLINELQKRLNTAMILITHDLGVVAQTCEKVMVMYAGEAIEYGTAEDIFETTQRHPYTQGLFNAIPKLDENTKRLEAIEGMMADPTQKIEGCRFADRCKYATAACKKAQKMREVTPGHFIRCCRFDPPQSNT